MNQHEFERPTPKGNRFSFYRLPTLARFLPMVQHLGAMRRACAVSGMWMAIAIVPAPGASRVLEREDLPYYEGPGVSRAPWTKRGERSGAWRYRTETT